MLTVDFQSILNFWRKKNLLTRPFKWFGGRVSAQPDMVFQKIRENWWAVAPIVYQVIVAASINRLAWETLSRVWTEIFHGAFPEHKHAFYAIAILSLVRLIMWLLRTNESKILPWRRKYFRALEPPHGRFLFIHAQTILSRADILTPQLLLDYLWWLLPTQCVATVWCNQNGTVWKLTLTRGYNFWTNIHIFILKTPTCLYSCLAKIIFSHILSKRVVHKL